MSILSVLSENPSLHLLVWVWLAALVEAEHVEPHVVARLELVLAVVVRRRLVHDVDLRGRPARGAQPEVVRRAVHRELRRVAVRRACASLCGSVVSEDI